MNDTNIGKTRDAFGVHSKLWTKLQRSPLTCFPEFHLLPFRKINPPQNTTPRENIAGRGVKYMPGGYPEQHLTAELQERVTCASCFSFPAIKKVPILEQKPSQELSWEGHQPSSPGVLFPPGRDERECGGGELAGGRTGTPASLRLGGKPPGLRPPRPGWQKNPNGAPRNCSVSPDGFVLATAATTALAAGVAGVEG